MWRFKCRRHRSICLGAPTSSGRAPPYIYAALPVRPRTQAAIELAATQLVPPTARPSRPESNRIGPHCAAPMRLRPQERFCGSLRPHRRVIATWTTRGPCDGWTRALVSRPRGIRRWRGISSMAPTRGFRRDEEYGMSRFLASPATCQQPPEWRTSGATLEGRPPQHALARS
jgi:hypothetical protein